MKRVVSVSLGSQKRNHKVEVNILGENFSIERIGTDGNIDLAIQKIRELDGKIDAFGMGGIDLYIVAGEKRYVLRDAKRIKEAARLSPMVDGSGLKNTLERRVIEYLQESKKLDFRGKHVLLVCGVDRFGMAEALESCGAQVTYGDLIFGLGIPFPLKSLKTLARAAHVIAPIASQLPFEMIYPTGAKQESSVDKFSEYYQAADIIAGDFLFIKRYLPKTLINKVIITNTVTPEDIELLKERGIASLITTTPELDGRSFGTNVMEAVLVALAGGGKELKAEEYQLLLDKVGFVPRILEFPDANLA
ncbi:MAG: quinate 5-dehydrogenase [Peptococcales bacterium]